MAKVIRGVLKTAAAVGVIGIPAGCYHVLQKPSDETRIQTDIMRVDMTAPDSLGLPGLVQRNSSIVGSKVTDSGGNDIYVVTGGGGKREFEMNEGHDVLVIGARDGSGDPKNFNFGEISITHGDRGILPRALYSDNTLIINRDALLHYDQINVEELDGGVRIRLATRDNPADISSVFIQGTALGAAVKRVGVIDPKTKQIKIVPVSDPEALDKWDRVLIELRKTSNEGFLEAGRPTVPATPATLLQESRASINLNTTPGASLLQAPQTPEELAQKRAQMVGLHTDLMKEAAIQFNKSAADMARAVAKEVVGSKKGDKAAQELDRRAARGSTPIR